MGFLKLLLNANNATGIREAMRLSYKKAWKQARHGGLLPPGTTPHQAALYGAFSSRLQVNGLPVIEEIVSLELLPFFLMPENESVQVLAEYFVAKERHHEANIECLRQWISWSFSEGGPAWSEGNQKFVLGIPHAMDLDLSWTLYVPKETLHHCFGEVTGFDLNAYRCEYSNT